MLDTDPSRRNADISYVGKKACASPCCASQSNLSVGHNPYNTTQKSKLNFFLSMYETGQT